MGLLSSAAVTIASIGVTMIVSMLDRVRSDALNVVGIGPRAVGAALADLRLIAERMGDLPRLLEVLVSIDAKVDELNDDVRTMRAGVQSLDAKVDELDSSLAPLKRLGRRSRRRAAEAAPDSS
jgi:hypothetical protein